MSERRPKVFVVQKTMRWDPAKGELVPKFDFSRAEEFGEVTYLLSPSASPWRTEPLIAEMKEKLRELQEGDYLLLAGNPVLIGIATAIAADVSQGKVSFLQWSGKGGGGYQEVIAENIFGY